MNYPFVYRVLSMHMLSYNHEWTLAAHSLGARLWQVRSTVQWRFMKKAIVRAVTVAFCLSLTEVGAQAPVHGSGVTLAMALRVYRKAGITHGMIGIALILFAVTMCASLVMLSSEKKFA
jgi:ABC-type Fe3+ transport system permease subunit